MCVAVILHMLFMYKSRANIRDNDVKSKRQALSFAEYAFFKVQYSDFCCFLEVVAVIGFVFRICCIDVDCALPCVNLNIYLYMYWDIYL